MKDDSKSQTKTVPTHQRKKKVESAMENSSRKVSGLREDKPPYGPKLVRFVDLFCGIGGFHIAMEQACADLGMKSKAVFASDIDKDCQIAYEANFSMKVHGDITKIDEKDVPSHDILVGGFPCQPFSIIGERKGFDDTRGTLFFDIGRIIKEKKPAAFVLENVKTLRGHDGGQTLKLILDTLEGLGYRTTYTVLNALNFGLPQKRERIWIVGNRLNMPISLPVGDTPMTPLSKILEAKVDSKHFASAYIRQKRYSVMKPGKEPTIWHENKAGNISSYPFSCALRAGASYNYLLVNGERRLTPREMFRLQGFPDSYKIISTDSQSRKQAGNSLPVNVAKAVLKELFLSLKWGNADLRPQSSCPALLSPVKFYNEKTKVKNS